MRPLRKIIDLAALAHNYRVLLAKAGGAQVAGVVKADAYGHGLGHLLPVLRDMPMFAVACIEEALVLRDLGLTQPVMLLEGVFAPDELPLCAAKALVPWLHDEAQLQWLKRQTPNLPFWLKVDSGMHRLGFAPESMGQLTAKVRDLHCLGIATHFACADEEHLAHAEAQWQRFAALSVPAHWQRSAANSAALFALPHTGGDWVRPGLALYGMSPFAHRSAQELGLRAVMTLQTEIIAIRYLQAGEGAGYGWHFRAEKSGYLATIALGYGDGFARRIDSGKVRVKIGGSAYPLVGRVAMDMCLVWLGETALPLGSKVTVFGGGHPAEKVAVQADTIPYTLTTMLTPRVHTHIVPMHSGASNPV